MLHSTGYIDILTAQYKRANFVDEALIHSRTTDTYINSYFYEYN